ncbi:MAG: metalloregulator ArsR/SmtB family transcription factor [Acidobacteria bacterium]|nr:metalloregulator ArsR/SmtB family transcription factor [Acidobacteriota bacterium]
MGATRNQKTDNDLAQLERLLTACADQTRMRILNMLADEGEISVWYLVEVLQTNQPKVSRHLAYLKRAGLVTDRKDGLRVYYRLASPLSVQAEKVLGCLHLCWQDAAEMQQDRMTLQMVLTAQPLAKLPVQAEVLGGQPMVVEVESQDSSEIQVELL